MRIVFVTPGYKPAWRIGGPVISVSALAEGVARRGHEVVVLTTNSNFDHELNVEPNCPHNVDGVEVWYFEKEEPLQRLFPRVAYLAKSIGTLYSPKLARKLSTIVPDADIVHTHLPFNYPTYAAAQAAFRFNKPLFYHQRGVLDPTRLKFRALKKKIYLSLVERPILRRANTVVALTDAERESYRSIVADVPCKVIPNGVDLPPGTTERGELTVAGARIDSSATLILFLGRIHPIKGADCLLEAFIRIHSSLPDAVLVMAGPDEFGLQEGFRQQVVREGLEGRVLFPGMVTGKAKENLLSRADLFCLPSEAEGFSMAVLEALAAGTAVMISPGCNFPDVATVGAGRITDAEPLAWSREMLAMLSNPSELRAMGERGRELVRTKYTWDVIVDKTIAMYEEGVNRHRQERNR